MISDFLKNLRDKIDKNLHELYPGTGAAEVKPEFTAPDPGVKRYDVPAGTKRLPRGALQGRRELVSVSVPASVRTIGERAFAGCENLESVTLHEGLRQIGENAFDGCKSLKRIVIPNSVKDVNGSAFKGSGIVEPVRTASGDTLIYCPASAAGAEYTVPEGVRRIGTQAFLELPGLKKVHLPRSLERIDRLAFIKCGFSSVSLPKYLEELEENAFFHCAELKNIYFKGEDPIREALFKLRARGLCFLKPVRCAPCDSDRYWEGPAFRALAEECVSGNAGAMERMVAFFEEKSKAAPEEAFYSAAANFWRYRAWENGSETQRQWLERYVKASPGERLPSACLTETLWGSARGSTLNALGFFFFAPERLYSFAGLDADGVAEVSAYESEDGPDEDGFGRETYYDWWYLDRDLRPVPGVACLHSYSNIDRRIWDVQDRFARAHDEAAKAGTLENIRRGLELEQEGLLEQAFKFYKRAADQGSGDAMFAVGNLYFHKSFHGIPSIASIMTPWDEAPLQPDMAASFRWFMKAAQAGNINAMSNVGVLLTNGIGCGKDPQAGRAWLEKAAQAGNKYAEKALHDFFCVPAGERLTDEAYDRQMEKFFTAVEQADTLTADGMYETLMNGTEAQLSRLGLRLAEARYGRGVAYWAYAYPNLRKDRSCAPVESFRCGWASAVVVNFRALPEGAAITFAPSGMPLVPVRGIRVSDETVSYEASDFGWIGLPRRRARVLRSAPGYVNENASEALKFCGVDVPALLEHLKLTEQEALFVECGEKEYSAEIGCLVGTELRVLLRYTIGGWDQGNHPAEVSGVTLDCGPEAPQS